MGTMARVMLSPRKPLVVPEQARENEGRKFGRIHCESAECELGPILDLSNTGLRAEVRKGATPKVGEKFPLTIHTDRGDVTVVAECVWSRKKLLRAASVGLRFLEVSAEAKRGLLEIVKTEMADGSSFIEPPWKKGRVA